MPTVARKLANKLKVGNVTVKTSSGDVTMSNEGVVIVLKDSGAATAVTLTPSPDTGDVVWVIDGKGDAATNNITVSGAAAETINGGASHVISENYGAVAFVYNGTEWNIASQGLSVAAAELAFINGVTAGAAAASKAVVLDASLNVSTINAATVTNLTTTNATVAGSFTLSGVASVNAAGTVIANAAALTGAVNVVAGADDAKGVVLPTAVAGKAVLVYSSQATNGLLVYPPVNGTINDGSANAAVTIEGKSLAMFIGTSATNWSSIFTANS